MKCFNTVSNAQMVDSSFEEGTLQMICGDDARAKERTESILVELGWPSTLDVGGIEFARYLEAFVPLWLIVGTKRDTWGHAFTAIE